MKKIATLVLACVALSAASSARADLVFQNLPFSQNWNNVSLITTLNDWSGVPGIIGYRGDDVTASTGVDPQTLTGDGTLVVNVTPQHVTTNISGGLGEFELPDPVVAFQGSGTADAPFMVISLITTGKQNIQVSYNLRDIDGTSDNAAQPVALQYRLGTSGAWTNVPAAFVADASTGPSIATAVFPVSVTLPAACNNQAQLQLRVITANAVGNDEWIGVDDISVTGQAIYTCNAGFLMSPACAAVGDTITVTPGISGSSFIPGLSVLISDVFATPVATVPTVFVSSTMVKYVVPAIANATYMQSILTPTGGVCGGTNLTVDPNRCAVPAARKSWGEIKSIYR